MSASTSVSAANSPASAGPASPTGSAASAGPTGQTGPTGPPTDERAHKRAAVLAILASTNADGMLLTSGGALSWYLGGARVHVSLAADPILAVIARPDGDTVIVSSSEAGRLRAEELPADVAVQAIPWDASVADVLARDPRTLVRESELEAELRAARAVLLPEERTRFESLSGAAAAVTTRVLAASAPHDTERTVAARIAHALAEVGADPLVVLVAGRKRLDYRHPLPTSGELGDLAMVVVCARRHGLVTNLTRWVGAGRERPEERDARARILQVEADFFGATRPGVSLGTAFETAVSAYGRHGFAPDEWRNHHQGGAAGYFGRDPRAGLGSTDTIRAGQAFAWNPSAPLAKVEDTVVIDEAGPTVLTVDPAWPTVLVRGLPRPDVLWR